MTRVIQMRHEEELGQDDPVPPDHEVVARAISAAIFSGVCKSNANNWFAWKMQDGPVGSNGKYTRTCVVRFETDN